MHLAVQSPLAALECTTHLNEIDSEFGANDGRISINSGRVITPADSKRFAAH